MSAVLQVALRDAFVDDTVVVSVAGSEVYRREGVRTRTQISLADTFETQVEPAGTVVVEVAVPTREKAASLELDPAQTPFLEVWLGDELTLEASAEPFRFL